MSLVHEFDIADNNKLTRIMVSMGSEGLQNDLRKEAGLTDERVILVINTTNKKATKPPLDEITLKRLTFYNVDSKRLESLDIDLSRQFYPNSKYRIYSEKEDKEKIKRIISAWA